MTDLAAARATVAIHYAALAVAIARYDRARDAHRAARVGLARWRAALAAAAAQLDACMVTYRAALATYADLAGPADPMAAVLADFDAHAARSKGTP